MKDLVILLNIYLLWSGEHLWTTFNGHSGFISFISTWCQSMTNTHNVVIIELVVTKYQREHIIILYGRDYLGMLIAANLRL